MKLTLRIECDDGAWSEWSATEPDHLPRRMLLSLDELTPYLRLFLLERIVDQDVENLERKRTVWL